MTAVQRRQVHLVERARSFRRRRRSELRTQRMARVLLALDEAAGAGRAAPSTRPRVTLGRV